MAKITILNSMAGTDFEKALDQHVSWGIEILDLKDAIFGKNIANLTLDEAKQAAEIIETRNLSVYCLSTGLFHGDIEAGENKFREDNMEQVGHVIQIGKILQAKMIRLLSAQTSRRKEIDDSIEYIHSKHPWLFDLYSQAIQQISDAGFKATIENEVGNCILASPQEILDFFQGLENISFTWDVQNLWQMGTYPTMDVYHKLKNLIGYYHLKGGQYSKDDSKELHWRSALEDASWPVMEITQQVVKDGVSPVICLNPSHGKAKDGYNYANITKRDLDFARRAIWGVE